MLNAQVGEKTVPGTDTLYFSITNPVEDYQRKYAPKSREVSYRISVTNKNGLSLSKDLGTIEGSSSKLVIPHGTVPDKIEISIEPHKDFGGRELGVRALMTVPYRVVNPSSNYFDISIPELTLRYLAYRRLNRDFVRIVNRHKLEWDGQIYVRH